MGSGLIGNSLSGLHAAQLGLQTTEHNIANVNTPGFTRQQVVQASSPGSLSGSGFVGLGVQVETIERAYNRYLTEQVNRSQAGASELEAYQARIAEIDDLLADPSTGLSPALQSFFEGVQQVAANPSDLSSRQVMISNAQALSSRFQTLSGRLAQTYDDVNGQVVASVKSINAYGTEIAALNERIGAAESSSGHAANDLRDSRDRLVLELNKLIQTRVSVGGDGSYNVFIGSGQQLVVGAVSTSLETLASASDPTRLVVGVKTALGVSEIPEQLVTGGALGGLLSFRREMLDTVSNDLGRNAASLALTFNAQSALGQDLFGQSQLTSPPSSFTPSLFSLAPPSVQPNAANPVGSATITAAFIDPPPYGGNFYTDLTRSDYRLEGTVAGVQLTRLADNKTWAAADLASLNTLLAGEPQGFTLSASSATLTGASYLIRPTHDAALNLAVNPAVATDPRLITAAAPLRTAAGGGNTGKATISAASVGPGFATAAASIPITLTYQGGNLTGFPPGAMVSVNGGTATAVPPGGLAYTSGDTLTLVGSVSTTPPAGVTFTITGLPDNGDTFMISRNAGGVADGRNALALGQLQAQKTMSGKTASYQDSYAQLVSTVGSKANQIQVSHEAQQTLLEQAQASRDAVSAVNLDDEAANLIRYQQAYQAAAKALQIGTSLFETILQIGA